MTAFITHCWKSARLELAVLLACVCLAWGVPLPAWAEPNGAEVSVLRLERSGDNILLSATVKFDLPATVEDALLKGMPVFFVAQASVVRERWYWTDKKLSSAERHMRLVYHPLTRRWRLSVAPEHISNNGQGVALHQNFDSVEDALAAVRRVSGWKIADISDIDPSARQRLEFMFYLDVSQLPRPLQIGVLGQSDWSISTSGSARLVPESLK